MKSRQVFRRNRVIFDNCSKRNNGASKWLSEPPLTRCLPTRQVVLNVSQIAATFRGIRPPFFVRTWLQQYRRCPSLILRTALSAIPLVSDLSGVDEEWFQDNSSHDLPNSRELSVSMTFGFLVGSKNFCKLFCVSWEVFCFTWVGLKNYVEIHILRKGLWLSNHQNCPLWARLYRCVSCKKPL